MTESSKEYAISLFSLAVEENREQAFSEDLTLVSNVFADVPELYDFLSSPAIPKAERTRIFSDALEGKVHPFVSSFMMLLCEHGRIRQFSECREEYELLLSQRQKTSHALIKSVIELTEEEKERLIRQLEKKTGRIILPTYETDPALIGGLVVEMENEILDGSLRQRLKTMKGAMEE